MTTATGTRSALAIDAGQTGMKVRVHRDGTRVLDRVMPGVRTHEPLLPQLSAVAHAVADETGDSFDVISTGVSGLTSRESDAAALMALLTDLGARRVILAHDSVTSFLGTLLSVGRMIGMLTSSTRQRAGYGMRGKITQIFDTNLVRPDVAVAQNFPGKCCAPKSQKGSSMRQQPREARPSYPHRKPRRPSGLLSVWPSSRLTYMP